MTALAPHLSAYLLEHLPRDRGSSRHTIDSYAFGFQLLVNFAAKRLGIRPSALQIEQLDAQLILDFLDYVEVDRSNTARTRNARLAAIRSFFRFLEYRVPACLDLAMQVQALPFKRVQEGLVDYLTRAELQAVLDAPDRRTRSGLQDRAMLYVAYACGLRVSELTGLQLGDVGVPTLDAIHVLGKGRRERVLPLWKETQTVLRDWVASATSKQRRGSLPQCSGRSDGPPRLRQSHRRPYENRAAFRPELGAQTGDAARPAAHLRHPHLGSDRRRQTSGAMARPRVRHQHRDLSADRSQREARHARCRCAAADQTRLVQRRVGPSLGNAGG